MGYTVQQIKVALELYDKLKKVTATVRQLGYPAKHTLYEWINLRSATEGQFPDIEPKGIKKINRKVQMNYEGFSAKQKLQILKRCFEGTENIRDVAISVGISRVIIYNWRKRYLQYGVLGLQKKKKNIPRTKSLDHKDNLKAQNSVHQSSDEIKLLKQQKSGSRFPAPTRPGTRVTGHGNCGGNRSRRPVRRNGSRDRRGCTPPSPPRGKFSGIH